jgi:hypothetical protein
MMSLFTQRTVLSAGLATLALALAPAAQAQIQVTGGVLDGDAAFFVPGGAGDISMFDIGVNNLQIVSPNGVLTNPLFQPTATGGFTDTDASNSVTAGDTGLITGKLSGVGFTATGGIVPFSQVDTALAYQVSRFSSSTAIPGTLINGDAIPQLFLPIAGITSTATGITTTDGSMEIGDFNSNLTAGVIDLPSTLEFRGSSSSTSSFFEVAGQRKIKFQFEGEDVTPTTFAQPSATELQFVGEANKKFKIQTFGDGNSSSFSLESSNGFVDITLGNVNSTAGSFGDINAANPLDYKIKGQTNGILAMFAPGQAAVQGSGRNTTFQFTQGGSQFKGNTAGGGDVTLFAAAGANSVDIDSTFTTFDASSLSSFQSATTTTDYSFTQNVTQNDFTINNISFGNLTLAFNGSFTLDGSTTFSTTSSTSLTEIQALIQEFLESIELDSLANSSTIAIFTGEGEGNVRYELVSSPTYQVRIKQKRNGDIKIKIKVRNHRGRRVLLALQGEFLAGAFEQVGSGSRMFPGMVGLRQLSDEEAAEIYEELQLSEAEEGDDSDTDEADDTDTDDADDGDDTDEADDTDTDDADDGDDTDEADDTDTDDADDGDDTDEADGSEEDPLPAPVFEGLDDLSPEEVDAINEQINSFGSDETAPADGTEADVADDTAPAEDAAAQ